MIDHQKVQSQFSGTHPHPQTPGFGKALAIFRARPAFLNNIRSWDFGEYAEVPYHSQGEKRTFNLIDPLFYFVLCRQFCFLWATPVSPKWQSVKPSSVMRWTPFVD